MMSVGLGIGCAAAVPADWTTPLTPFRIAGNLYYVGSRDLAAYLVVTPRGNILINSNLTTSPPQIRASVEALGFRWTDTRILLSSQAHNDHVSGAAQIMLQTGAQQMAMEGDAEVIESGGAAEYDTTLDRFPASHVDRILHDGDTVTLGGTILVAHKTAGHTRGCTTWTMQAHEGQRNLNVVIVCGWAANPAVRLVSGKSGAEGYPGIARDFERTFETLKALPCDIFLGAHGLYFDLLGKLARSAHDGAAVWIDPQGYQDGVRDHEAAFRRDLARQTTAP